MARRLVSEAELRTAFIESDETPWPRIRSGDFDNRCTNWVDRYHRFFEQQGIACARLSSGYHAMLALDTTDAGVLIFDPSFRQFYNDYPQPYFLGTAQALVDHIQAHGGWGRMWEEGSRGPINARGAFSRRHVDLPLGVDRAHWHAAFEAIPPQRNWQGADGKPQRRSSIEVSP